MSSLEQYLAERHDAEVLSQRTDLTTLGGGGGGSLRNIELSRFSRAQFSRQEEAALTNANALTRVERHIFATSGTFTVGVNDIHRLQETASTEMRLAIVEGHANGGASSSNPNVPGALPSGDISDLHMEQIVQLQKYVLYVFIVCKCLDIHASHTTFAFVFL